MVEEATIPTHVHSVSLDDDTVSPQMRRAITMEEDKIRENFPIGIRNLKTRREFVKVQPGYYFYCSNMYIIMSKVTLTQLQECGVKIDWVKMESLEECKNENHCEHDGFLPFFYDNNSLLRCYDKILQKDLESQQRKKEVQGYRETLIKAVRMKMHRDTCFYTNGLPDTTSWDLEENEWTCRLFHCLKRYLPETTSVHCSFGKGQMFADYQSLYSGTNFSGMYLFQGAPDLIATTHKPSKLETDVLIMSSDSDSSDPEIASSDSVVKAAEGGGYWEDNSDSENDTTIELTRATIPVNAVTRLPEKLGELMAGLHFLLVAKIVRKVVQKKSRKISISEVAARGILVDKTNGIIHCHIEMPISPPESPVKMSASFICNNGRLDSSSLCHNLCQLTSF